MIGLKRKDGLPIGPSCVETKRTLGEVARRVADGAAELGALLKLAGEDDGADVAWALTVGLGCATKLRRYHETLLERTHAKRARDALSKLPMTVVSDTQWREALLRQDVAHVEHEKARAALERALLEAEGLGDA